MEDKIDSKVSKIIEFRPEDFAAAVVKYNIHLDIPKEEEEENYIALAFEIYKKANPHINELVAFRRADLLVYDLKIAEGSEIINRAKIGTASNVEQYIPQDYIAPEQLATLKNNQPATEETPLEGPKKEALQSSYRINEYLEHLLTSDNIANKDLEKISEELDKIEGKVEELVQEDLDAEVEKRDKLKAEYEKSEKRADTLERLLGKNWRLKNGG